MDIGVLKQKDLEHLAPADEQEGAGNPTEVVAKSTAEESVTGLELLTRTQGQAV